MADEITGDVESTDKAGDVFQDKQNDLTQIVDMLALGQDNVTVEDYAGRCKVSGRCAHYIRDAVEDDHRIRVKNDINQYAFSVEWDA